MKKFSVVFVTFNSSDVIAKAIQSIGPDHDVIVVDNASSDTSVELAKAHGARTMVLEKNLGFGVACNRGAAMARTDYLLFLNPDALPEQDALHTLLNAFEKYPDTAAFNPRLIEGDGEQYFRRRNQFLPRTRIRREVTPCADREINILSGAAVAIRKSAFDAVGGFDENIFLYFEDDDLSAQLILAGFKIRYIHDAVVHHAAGRSSPSSAEMTMFREYHAMISKRYMAKKYGLRFFGPVRLGQEWMRARFGKQDSPLQLRAKARLKALSELLINR